MESSSSNCCCGSVISRVIARRKTTRQQAISSLSMNLRRFRRHTLAFEKLSSPPDSGSIEEVKLLLRCQDAVRTLGVIIKESRNAGSDWSERTLDIGGVARSLCSVHAELRALRRGLDDPLSGLVPVHIESENKDLSSGKDPEDNPKPRGAGLEILIAGLSAAAAALGAVIGKWFGELFIGLFNATDDDDARKWVAEAPPEKIRATGLSDLTNLITAMLDGPTGGDDEVAILKILSSLDCPARNALVNQVGLNWLLSDVDGENWDNLVNLLVECGIISFGQMDDDASRLFVGQHTCVQLSQLSLGSVHQLVLNMFSGSCGDDDEQAILKLIKCQSYSRLHTLVQMPGTDVAEFDWKFDGDEWDELDQVFSAYGLALES